MFSQSRRTQERAARHVAPMITCALALAAMVGFTRPTAAQSIGTNCGGEGVVLCGTVWYDVDDDGIQDASETGIGGVKVTVNDAYGTPVFGGEFVTSSDGTYYFDSQTLPPGNYTVVIDSTQPPLGAGVVASPSNIGSDDTVDSDGSGATAGSSRYDITISDTFTANDVDFGFFTGPPPALPCPAGSFSFSVDAAGNLNIVFDQFPAPNDNSYGVNAVGWGSHGHKFSDLVGSDHAGLQLKDPNGVVKLSFNVDYISAAANAPSGYASLGPFGGDGKVLVGALTTADIAFTTSLANNLNNVNIPGLFDEFHVQQFGSVNVLIDSPPTDPAHETYANSDPALTGWDFHDTYFVTISAAKLASIGFDPATWVVEPNLDALHNSPAKACPSPQSGGQTLSVTKTEVKDKQVKITLLNSGSVDEFITGVQASWPVANGKLMQVKLDGDVIYDRPDIPPPSANLTLAQLVGDKNKRKIGHGTSDVLTLVFQNNADKDLSRYTGMVSTSGFALTILP